MSADKQAHRYQQMTYDTREVLLHVKRERVRVTSDLGAQIRYTSRLRTLLGFREVLLHVKRERVRVEKD